MTRLGLEPRTYGLKVKKARSPSTESSGKTGTSEPTEQALRRKAGQAPVQEVGDLRLVDAHQVCGRGLRELAPRDRAGDLGREARLEEPLLRPREPQVGKHIATALDDLHSSSTSPRAWRWAHCRRARSEEHTSELQSRVDLVCRLLL